MKYLSLISIASAIILSACSKSSIDQLPESPDAAGVIQLDLSIDESLKIVNTKSDMDASLIPPVDDFYVELYRFEGAVSEDASVAGWWKRLHFGTVSELFETVETDEGTEISEETDVPAERKFKQMRVNAGKWKLIAFHGDSTACGFDKPFFFADEEFIVEGGVDQDNNPNITHVNADARVNNARITIDFDETVPGSFYDYFVRLTNLDMVDEEGKANKYKQILRYRKGQEKDAYMMPTQNLQVEFMAQYEYADESSWKFVNLGTVAVNPNDHLTIKLSVNPRNGGLDVNITTDENIVEKKSDIEILEMWAPQDPPQIVAAGFTDGDHPVVEGDRTGNNATISVLARAGLKNFYVRIDSEYLGAAGFDIPLGEEIDIANPTAASQAKIDRLIASGISWDDDMLGSRRLTYLTMTELFERINELNPSLSVKRNLFTMTIRVEDEVGNYTEETLTSTAYPITQVLSIDEGNVWAKKIVSPRLTVERGVSSLYELQVSTDGRTWTEDFRTFEAANNMVLDFGTIPTSSNTKYYFRTVYNNNPNLVSNVVEVTTETEQQVGNPGFEYWHTEVLTVSRWFDTKDREWYLPYLSYDDDPWWAVNSRRTMPGSTTPENFDYKVFPCAAYSTGSVYSGEKSAMIYTVSVNDYNISSTSLGDNVPGEIWIGRADDNGNHASDGHQFSSRPASLKFWYNYISYNNENFIVTFVLKDAAGNEIARVEKTDGIATGEWSQCEIPIVYSDLKAKAANIYIGFKSCSSGVIQMSSTMEIAGKNQTSHIGSVLRIDDIELIY